MLLPFVPVLLGSQLIIAVADPIPTIDVQNTCRAAAGVFTGTTTQNDVDICVSSEQRAREQIIKDWAQYAPTDRARCVQAGAKVYLPSYVEWLTCFEMEREVRKIRQEQPASAPPARNARRQSSKTRLGSETSQCPVVEVRADGSIASIIAC